MATILLVDDDSLHASCMVSLLRRRFADVRRAADAAEAFCLIEEPDFASTLGLVIAGQHRPGVDGADFVAELRARLPLTPILVLGTEDESAAEYAGLRVVFAPTPLKAERVLALAEEMLRHDHDAAA